MAAYAAHTTNQSTHLLTPQTKKDKSHTKEPTFQKIEVQQKTDQENGPKADKDKTETATGLGRKTREDIQKSGIKLAALRFKTEGEDIRNPLASFRGNRNGESLGQWYQHCLGVQKRTDLFEW